MRIHEKPVKIAFMFPGQGLEPLTKGIETLTGKGEMLESIVQATRKQTRRVLEDKLFKRVANSNKKERTADTQLSQLAAAYEGTVLARAFFHYRPFAGSSSVEELCRGSQLDAIVAGHSVSGIVAAGFEPLLFSQGRVADSGRFNKVLAVIMERGRIMLAHYREQPGAHRMGVVINKDNQFCEALVQLAMAEYGEGSVSISGHNAPIIHTIAGDANEVDYAMRHAKSSGATVIGRLNDYGFHDKGTMHGCAIKLKEFLKRQKSSLQFNPYFPVISSRNAKIMKKSGALLADFWRGVEEPVMWHCGGSNHKKYGRGFVVDTLVRQGYNVHVVFARELKGWERDLEEKGQATVIAVTDYKSLVAGHEKILELVAARKAAHYHVR